MLIQHGIVLSLLAHFSAAQVDDDIETVGMLDIVDVQHDSLSVVWDVPDKFANDTNRQMLMVETLKSSTKNQQDSKSLFVNGTVRSYTFEKLSGNTTYRASVQALNGELGLWYASNVATTGLAALDWLPHPTELTLSDKTNDSLEISWAAPIILETGHRTIINQHLINVYEYSLTNKIFAKKDSITVPIPKTLYRIGNLIPGGVYNITVQAGTSYGYGNLAWAAYSTLGEGDELILKQRARTPNSITLVWPVNWLPSLSSKFTIRAKTVYSPVGEKEINNEAILEPGKTAEYTLRNLNPGSTYNVSITTVINSERSRKKWNEPMKTKTAWAVFSTLTQGEYTVTEARLAIETDVAASIVFQPLRLSGSISYQVRYTLNDLGTTTETREYTEDELKCPKFGCNWACLLVYNVPRRPRDYKFEVRVKVDNMWNKWSTILRRPWNMLERACSIAPPSSYVENVNNLEYQREIELKSGLHSPVGNEPWRYLVVVDSRGLDYAAIDITKLADRTTADYEHTPYYIAASLTPEEVKENTDFRIGDGEVHGGYLNYPLRENKDPIWTLVSIAPSENELMEPQLRRCGFSEDGIFDCQMGFSEFFSHIPLWVKSLALIFLAIFIFMAFVLMLCCCRRLCDGPTNSTKESSVMYYHVESPQNTSITQDYKRVERREFSSRDREARRRFLEDDD